MVNDGTLTLPAEDMSLLKDTFRIFVVDVLGLLPEGADQSKDELVQDLMNTIIHLRKEARDKKDFATSDRIRDELEKINIRIKDTKDGTVWEKF